MKKNSLNDKIEAICKIMIITKKSRMNAEDRLLRKDKFLEQVVINYSVFIIALSIINLGIESSIINYLLVVASLIVLSVSLYRGSENLLIRAKHYKENYIEIGKLENELYVKSPEKLSEERVLEIDNKYQDVLMKCENHRFRDYHKTLEKCNNQYSDIKNFWWGFCEEAIKIVFLYILPTAVFFYVLLYYLDDLII